MDEYNHVWITAKQLVRFEKNKFDEMLCKLDSAKYARAFQMNPTLVLPEKRGSCSMLGRLSIVT